MGPLGVGMHSRELLSTNNTKKTTVQNPAPPQSKQYVPLQHLDPDQALVNGTVQRFPSLFWGALVRVWSAHGVVRLSVFSVCPGNCLWNLVFHTIETSILQKPVQRPMLNLKQGTSPKETRSNRILVPIAIFKPPPSTSFESAKQAAHIPTNAPCTSRAIPNSNVNHSKRSQCQPQFGLELAKTCTLNRLKSAPN